MNDAKATYSLGTVTEVLSESSVQAEGKAYIQELEVTADDGQKKQVILGTEYEPITAEQRKNQGERVVLISQQDQNGVSITNIADAFRLSTVFWLFFLFSLAVVAVSRFKGLLSILGMILSFVVITSFVVPYILLGYSPIIISLIGALGIGIVTLYLSHGFTVQSHIALASIMISLTVVAILSALAVQSASLFGLGSEEAYFLQFSSEVQINLRGLLLGGILLGALGVLDDVAVSQVSVVAQIKSLKHTISFGELYGRSLEVGKDHVASLVNTLVLAYAGANLPLFLLFTLNTEVPHWVTLNSEIIIEEVIRTLAGSIGLVLAVPLTTALASAVILKLSKEKLESLIGHSHHTH